MRRILQNKVFVAAMCVCAVLAVGWRVLALAKPGLLEGAAREPASLVPPLDAQPGFVQPETVLARDDWPDYRTNLLDWPDLFPVNAQTRDPFAPARLNLEPVDHPASFSDLPGSATLVLQAISIQAGQTLAVINRQIIAPGETIGEFVVEKILAHEVWLKHPQGRHVLSLQFGAAEDVPDRTAVLPSHRE